MHSAPAQPHALPCLGDVVADARLTDRGGDPLAALFGRLTGEDVWCHGTMGAAEIIKREKRGRCCA